MRDHYFAIILILITSSYSIKEQEAEDIYCNLHWPEPPLGAAQFQKPTRPLILISGIIIDKYNLTHYIKGWLDRCFILRS